MQVTHHPNLPGDLVRQWRAVDGTKRTIAGTAGSCAPALTACRTTAVSSWWYTAPRTAWAGSQDVVRSESATLTSEPSLFSHPIRLRPAGAVKAAKPKRVTKGKAVKVRATVTLKYLGDTVKNSKATLQYRPRGGTWRSLKSVRSNHAGVLATSVKVGKTGQFRWVLADAGAKHSGATSAAVTVKVAPRR